MQQRLLQLQVGVSIAEVPTIVWPGFMRASLRLGVRRSKINCFWAPNPHFDLASSSDSGGYIVNSLFSSRFVHEPCKNAQNARLGHFRSQVGASEHTAPSAYFPRYLHHGDETEAPRTNFWCVNLCLPLYTRDLKMMPRANKSSTSHR